MARRALAHPSDGPRCEGLEPRLLLSTLSVANLVLPEGNAGSKDFNFTVSLSEAAGQDVTVHYRTLSGTATAGEDYAAVADGVVAILAGQTQGTATVATRPTSFSRRSRLNCSMPPVPRSRRPARRGRSSTTTRPPATSIRGATIGSTNTVVPPKEPTLSPSTGG